MIIGNIEISTNGKILKIAKIKAEKFIVLENPEKIINALNEKKNKPDIFTFLQQELSDTNHVYNYFFEWDNIAVIKINSYKKWFTKMIPKGIRHNIKKAKELGIIIKIECLDENIIKGIRKINNETPVRQGRRFPHFGKDLETIKKEHATFLERSDFICAYYNKELIGYIKLVYVRQCAVIMQYISLIKYRRTYVNNAMIAKAVEICDTKKINYLIFGRYEYGNKGADGLTKFKKNNGFTRLNIPRYYIPLTFKGRMAIRLGLHKEIIDIIPKIVLKALLTIRSTYYKIRT